MQQPENAIVVGFPLEGGEGALTFAVAEAERSGSPIHLVHVLALSAGESYAGIYSEAVDASQAAVDNARERARELCGSRTPVTSELVDSGWTVGELVTRSLTARMVVLEHRDLGRVQRLFTGSISNGVSSKARSAVVTVPAGWTPEPLAAPDRKPVVVVAVQDPHEATELLRAAFEAARERQGSLIVLHAWWMDNGYDDLIDIRNDHDNRGAHAARELGPVVAELQKAYPTVEATTEIVHAPALDAVLDVAERADLLVIGRRHHRLPLGTHLGPVSRGVLGHSKAPVLMVPESAPVPLV